MISKWTICTLFAVLGVATLLQAADVTGSIDGLVKDASGAVAQGIDITVTNTATSAVFQVSGHDDRRLFRKFAEVEGDQFGVRWTIVWCHENLRPGSPYRPPASHLY